MSQWQCEKKLARRLFNFGVVNTTDDDCEQQMPSVALRLQQLIAPAVRRRSAWFNSTTIAWLISYVVWRQVEQETVLTINICTYFVFETRISPESSVWEGSDCSSKINDANFQLPLCNSIRGVNPGVPGGGGFGTPNNWYGVPYYYKGTHNISGGTSVREYVFYVFFKFQKRVFYVFFLKWHVKKT